MFGAIFFSFFVFSLVNVAKSFDCPNCYGLILVRRNDLFYLADPIGAQTDKYPYGSEETLYVACPGRPRQENYYDDENLLYARKTINADDRTQRKLMCEYEVRTTIERDPVQPYADNPDWTHLKLYRVGFKIYKNVIAAPINSGTSSGAVTKDENFQFITIMRILFDTKRRTSRWVSYSYHGGANHGMLTMPSRSIVNYPNYWNKIAYGDKPLKDQYDHEYEYTKKVLNDKVYVTKTYLASYLHFAASTWQHVAYQDAATAPMYYHYTRDWKILDFLIRDVGDIVKTLHIQSGPSAGFVWNYETVYVNQSEKLVEVPFFFWKVIVNYSDSPVNKFKEGIILIMYSLPIEEPPFVCQDRTVDSHWVPSFIQTFSGKTRIMACELNDENSKKLRIPNYSEFRQAPLFDLEKTTVIDSNGVKTVQNLVEKFANENKYYYYNRF